MDYRKLLAVVRRYWVAVFAVLVLTAVAVVLVPAHISPDYDARGTVILLSPSTATDSSTGQNVGINPWSRFGASGEGVAATAIIEVLQSKAVEEVVLDDDAVQEYSITANPGGNGAILDISVLASTDDAAVAAFDLIVDRLAAELESRQEAAGAPADTRLESNVLTRPDSALELQGSRTRAMLALVVLGAIAAVAVAVALDTLFAGRRDRAADGSPASTQATDDETPDKGKGKGKGKDKVGDEPESDEVSSAGSAWGPDTSNGNKRPSNPLPPVKQGSRS